jgi:hypothetical protein
MQLTRIQIAVPFEEDRAAGSNRSRISAMKAPPLVR